MKRVILGLLVLTGAGSAACASAIAKAAPDRPALEVPAPPAKVIEPPPQPEPAVPPVPELPPPQPTNSRPSKPPTRETAKPDPKQEAAATTETPAAPLAPVAPPPQLRPGNTPDPSEAAKQAQTAVDKARQVLSSLNARQVPKDKRAVFDDAHRMLTLAEEALKKSDFENAKKLAEKVESTARELGAR
jgi:hypothetical protein